MLGIVWNASHHYLFLAERGKLNIFFPCLSYPILLLSCGQRGRQSLQIYQPTDEIVFSISSPIRYNVGYNWPQVLIDKQLVIINHGRGSNMSLLNSAADM